MTNISIVGLQWGDEGKGKIVDCLSDKFDAVVRFQGGHNAGHTIKVDDKTYKLSLLPSGIIRNKFSVIGSGVVVDPIALFKEIERIEEQGLKVLPGQLAIADNACLILSVHQELDQLLEAEKGENKIGTTGRGIGPAYEDRAGRRAIRICDLYDDKILKDRLKNFLFYHNLLRKSVGAELVTVEKIVSQLEPIRARLLSYVQPSFEIYRKLAACKNVMFEGAQGVLLDVTYGTYPFVTSSNTMSGQVALGSCMGAGDLHNTIGILKAYTTRVGSGPFPTELTNEIGKFLQVEGNEIGTVTGRDRRCGWFDAALVKQAIKVCSVKEIALTKLDVLDKLEKIKICVAYKINGETYDYLPQASHLWDKIEPVYEEMDGWQEVTVGAKSVEDLPQNARAYIARIEALCDVKSVIISTGPKREQTLILKDLS